MNTDISSRIRLAAANADQLRSLHETERPLVLPNAWDAMSAMIVAARGAKAIATTSGGVSWALGCRDGQGVDRHSAVDALERIVAAVRIPVSADIEGGYGSRPEEVAMTVDAVVGIGVAGINLEDSPGNDAALMDAAHQAARIEAARATARSAGVALLVNARTDVYLFGRGVYVDPFDEVTSRADRYAEAGADSLFVPGLVDLGALARLVERSPLPINVMAGPGAPTIAQLAEVGVRRVSLGTSIAQAAYAVVDRAAAEILEHGTYASLDEHLSYAQLNELAERSAT